MIYDLTLKIVLSLNYLFLNYSFKDITKIAHSEFECEF